MKECRDITVSWEEVFFDKDEQTAYVYIHEIMQDGDAVRYVHTTKNQRSDEVSSSEQFGLIVSRHKQSHCCKIRWQDGTYSLFHTVNKRFFGVENQEWFYVYIPEKRITDGSFLHTVTELMRMIMIVLCEKEVGVTVTSELVGRFENLDEINEYTFEDDSGLRFLIRFSKRLGLTIIVCADAYSFMVEFNARGGFAKDARGKFMYNSITSCSICCTNIKSRRLVDEMIRQYLDLQ